MAMTSTERSRKRRAVMIKSTGIVRINTEISIEAKKILDSFTVAGATQRKVFERLLFDAFYVANATDITKNETADIVAHATHIAKDETAEIVAHATEAGKKVADKQGQVIAFFTVYGGYNGIRNGKKQADIVNEVFDGDWDSAASQILKFKDFESRTVKKCVPNTTAWNLASLYWYIQTNKLYLKKKRKTVAAAEDGNFM